MTNPLKPFSRTPKIYVRLPTQGKFYPENFIASSPNNEVPVKAMTASDDMIINNPDALLNGDAVYTIIQSCLNQCKDVHKLLIPDVEVILAGIRYASKGDNLKFKTKCPHCSHETEEIVSIRMLLDASTTIDDLEEKPCYEISDNPEQKVRINMHPSPYDTVTQANIVVFEQARLIQFMQDNPEISMEERNDRLRKSFDRLATFQLNILLSSIESVDIVAVDPTGQEVVTKVTDKNHIKEFIDDLEKEHAEGINKKLETLNGIGLPSDIDIQCDECGEMYPMEVKFDPSNFSEDTFSPSKAKT